MNNDVYLVLDYADCGSLAGFIDRKQELGNPAVFSILRQITEAVKYIHGLGFVHHDIKPSNILLRSDGLAMLGDLGIGHSFGSADMVMGSPAFQAPEALEDREDESREPQKEDIWALGITLYQALFRRLPFCGRNLYEVVHDIREHPLVVPEGTDQEIKRLLEGMLCVDPKGRFGVEEVLESPLLKGGGLVELPEAPPPTEKCGEVLAIDAIVCDEKYPFGGYGTARRFSDEQTAKKRARARSRTRAPGSYDAMWRRSIGPLETVPVIDFGLK
jgi:serine/threonine-protein kinase 11